jgi:hypothetical protein
MYFRTFLQWEMIFFLSMRIQRFGIATLRIGIRATIRIVIMITTHTIHNNTTINITRRKKLMKES